MKQHPIVLGCAVTLLLGVAGCSKAPSFQQDVLPILNEHCLSCHSGDGEGVTASGFSVESYAKVMKGTRLGPVVVPGSHTTSTLILLVEGKAHPSINMPKGQTPLAEEKLEVLRRWVDAGALDN